MCLRAERFAERGGSPEFAPRLQSGRCSRACLPCRRRAEAVKAAAPPAAGTALPADRQPPAAGHSRPLPVKTGRRLSLCLSFLHNKGCRPICPAVVPGFPPLGQRCGQAGAHRRRPLPCDRPLKWHAGSPVPRRGRWLAGSIPAGAALFHKCAPNLAAHPWLPSHPPCCARRTWCCLADR